MRRLSPFILLTCLLTTGCSYMCHDYDPFLFELSEDGWKVAGDITRRRPEDWRHGPGSWPHWGADEDDRYQLVLRPAVADSSYWLAGNIEFVRVQVIAGQDTIHIHWAKKEDLAPETEFKKVWDYPHYKGISNPPVTGNYNEFHEIGFGRFEFESEYFFLTPPLPDKLYIHFDLKRHDGEGHEIMPPLPVRIESLIHKHRRWHIVDAFES